MIIQYEIGIIFLFFCPLFLISLWFSTWNFYICLGIFWNLESKWFNTSSRRIVFFSNFLFCSIYFVSCFFFRNIIALMEHKGRDDQDEGNNFVVLVWTTKLKKSRNKKKWQGNNANMSSRVWLECYQRGSHLSRVSLGPRSRDVPYIYTL